MILALPVRYVLSAQPVLEIAMLKQKIQKKFLLIYATIQMNYINKHSNILIHMNNILLYHSLFAVILYVYIHIKKEDDKNDHSTNNKWINATSPK